MRKFTKEIAALLATAAAGASMGAAPAELESTRTEGVAVDQSVWDEEITPTEGVAVMPDTPTTTSPSTTTATIGTETTRYTTTTTTQLTATIGTQTTTYTTTLPALTGTSMPVTETTTMPPYAGGVWGLDTTTMVGTETTKLTTTTTTTTIPPLAGVMSTIPTTVTMPPLMGDMAVADGDTNGDGAFSISDVVIFQKYLLNAPNIKINNWYAADLNYDGELDVFDLIMLKRKLLNQTNGTDSSRKLGKVTLEDIIALSNKKEDLTWDDFKDLPRGDDFGSGVNVYRYEVEGYNDKFELTVIEIDNELISAYLVTVNSDTEYRCNLSEGCAEKFIKDFGGSDTK